MFNSLLFVSQEEAETLKKQQKEVETRNLGKEELARMKKELQDSHEAKMSEMQKMVKYIFLKMLLIPNPTAFNEIWLSFQVENTLKETCAAHEHMMRILKENLQRAQGDNESLRKEHDQAAKRRAMVQLGLALPAIVATGFGVPCNIL